MTSVRGVTDGMCFPVFAAGADGGQMVLREHWLHPVERLEVRGEHRISLSLSLDTPSALIVETDSGGNSSLDWAYWKGIDVTP